MLRQRVDAALAILGHQEEAGRQIARIQAGQVGARGFTHMSQGELINYRNDCNQRYERNKQADLAMRALRPSYRMS